MPPRHNASRLEKFRYAYGAEPLHLLATLASLAVAMFVILRIFELPMAAAILIWLGAAIVAHDLITLPLYTAFLRVAEETTDAAVEPRRRALLTLNHIRIPLAFSVLLLIVDIGLIFQFDPARYEATTGLTTERYLGNWLLISAALFVISGLHYAWRLRGKGSAKPMFQREGRTRPVHPPGKALTVASKGVLAVGALLALWVAALAIYGLFSSFPL